MIVAEREPVVVTKYAINPNLDRFGEAMPDGRLTEPSGGTIYRLREAILQSKKLGRPLTDEEMEEFKVF